MLLFIGIGAMIDFGPLLSNPKMFLFGAAAQFGIFVTIVLAALLGFDLKDAASIGIIGAADGPTSILVSPGAELQLYRAPSRWQPTPIWPWCPSSSPSAIKLVTTKKERGHPDGLPPQRSVTKTTAHPVPHHGHHRGRPGGPRCLFPWWASSCSAT